jgi:hypothetical protein
MPNADDDGDAQSGSRFPFIPLKMAIERARVLYKNGSGHPVPASELAKLWGYSDKASGWRQTAASLAYYGLVQAFGVKDDRQLKPTEDARRYFLDERPDEHAKLHAKFALAPQAFAALWKLWGANPPSDSVARSILKTQFHYPENSAAQLLTIYKANLTFAALTTRSQDTSNDGKGDPAGKEIPFPEDASNPSNGREPGFVQVTPPAGAMRQSLPDPAPHGGRTRLMEQHERELTTGMLSKDANFRLIVSGKIGAKEIERLIRKLQVDKEILADADHEETTEAAASHTQ